MNANKQDAGGLPELPEPEIFEGNWETVECYTADQMRAYGELCRAAPAGGDKPVAEVGELSGARLVVLYSVEEIGRLPKGTKLYTRPKVSAPAGSGEVEDDAWKVGMFDRWDDYAKQLGYTGMCDALSSIPLLRKLQQGAE